MTNLILNIVTLRRQGQRKQTGFGTPCKEKKAAMKKGMNAKKLYN